MQTRRQTGLTPLAIVLPHPPLPRRTSSLLSANSSSSLSLAAADPHTPRSCHSPCLLSVYYPPNRNSSDSWTSSNADDSMEFEWLSEQVLLLSRTLDALPAHLVTPFHGPVPPSNLLDKIARGVSQAKGPVDWPHSIRATRVKLLELARSRAKEEAAALERGRCAIKEEVEVGMDVDSRATSYSYFHEGQEKHLSPDVRRPLYRQSSMDFIKPSLEDIKGNTSLTRLSKRLQRSDRLFSNSAYHPYTRPPAGQDQASQRRSSSPPAPTDVPSLISPSTPSSSTLNTISSLGFSSSNNNHVLTPRILRHSASSSMFSTSSVGVGMGIGGPLTDPRLERIRYTDAGSPPAVPPKDYSVKRAAGCKRVPAYGAAAQEVKHQAKKKVASDAAAAASVPISATYSAVGASVAAVGVGSVGAGAGKGGESQGPTHTRNISLGSCPSSDEEETARSKRAKKVKTKSGVGTGVNAGTNVAAVGRREDSVVAPSRLRSRSSSTKTGTDAALSSPVGLVPMRPCEVNTKAKSYPKSSVVERIRGKDEDNKGSGNNSKTGTAALDEQTKTKVKTKSRSRPLPMNLQRNPSMLGAELPLLSDAVGSVPMSVSMSTFKYTSPPGPGKAKTKVRSPVPEPVPVPALGAVHDIASCLTKKNGTIPLLPAAPTSTTFTSSPRTTASPLPVRSAILSPSTRNLPSPSPFTLSPAPAPSPAYTQSPSPIDSPGSPAMQRVRTLRRVRRLTARRISFGSLVDAVGEESREEDGRDVEKKKEKERECLGSAFQLI